jgi:tetratricopeptide (TPR) repeat protein
LQAGGLEYKVYTIHRLTYHFVASQAAGQAGWEERILRAGEYYLAYARQHEHNWAALSRRQDHILQAMQLCAGPSSPSGQSLGPAGQRIAVECARVLNTCMVRRGHAATWLPYLDLALQAAADLGDETSQADLWNRLGQLKVGQGEPDVALTLHQRAATTFRCLADDRNLARSLRLEGNVHYTRSDLAAALACYEQARDLLAPVAEPDELSHVYNNIGNVHFNRGDWAQALACYEQALDLLDPQVDPRNSATLGNNVGLLRWQMGHWRRAVEILLQALPLLQLVGDRLGQANAHHYLCLAYADLEAWEPALDHGHRALALYKALDSTEGLADFYTSLASVCQRTGDDDGADDYLKLATSLWQTLEQPGEMDRTWLVRGDLCRQRGAWPPALEAYREALALLEGGGDPSRRLLALLGLAEAWLRLDDRSAAQALLHRAEALAGELARPDLCVRVSWLQAELHPSAARSSLHKALVLCGEGSQDDDRLARLGRETQARLQALVPEAPGSLPVP